MEFEITGCISLSIKSHLLSTSICGRTPNKDERKSSFRPERGILEGLRISRKTNHDLSRKASRSLVHPCEQN